MAGEQPLSILLIEDDKASADHIAFLLSQEDHHLARASSITLAREMMASHRVEVVLLDLELPGTSDEECLGEVERLSPGVPVVLLTRMANSERARHALRLGAQDYLVKGSFSSVDLWRTLRYAIERNRFVSRLESLYRERDRVVTLLRRALVPGRFFQPPAVEVGHLYVPSSILSGDYYDLIQLPYGRIGLVMADVAGKGTDAAIDAVRMKAIIQTDARIGFSPAAILGLLNDVLLEEDPPERTVSCFLVQLSPFDGHMRYACGGHEPVLLVSPDSGPVRELRSCDVLVGALPGHEYTEHDVRLQPGDMLLLYTDGVTDSRSPTRDFYGRERLIEVVDQHRKDAPQDVVDAIHEAVHSFSGGVFADDLSLLCVRWLGPPPS